MLVVGRLKGLFIRIYPRSEEDLAFW